MIYEAFQASFTGQMSTVRINNGKVYTFRQPLPRVVRNRFYVLAFDPSTGNCRMLIVTPPEEV